MVRILFDGLPFLQFHTVLIFSRGICPLPFSPHTLWIYPFLPRRQTCWFRRQTRLTHRRTTSVSSGKISVRKSLCYSSCWSSCSPASSSTDREWRIWKRKKKTIESQSQLEFQRSVNFMSSRICAQSLQTIAHRFHLECTPKLFSSKIYVFLKTYVNSVTEMLSTHSSYTTVPFSGPIS